MRPTVAYLGQFIHEELDITMIIVLISHVKFFE